MSATAPSGVRGAATAAAVATNIRRHEAGEPQAAGVASSSSSRRSPLAQVLAAVTGSATHGGLGALLPAMLVLTLLGGTAMAVRRRDRTP